MMNRKARLFELVLVIFVVILAAVALFVFYQVHSRIESYYFELPATVVSLDNEHQVFEMQQRVIAEATVGETFKEFFDNSEIDLNANPTQSFLNLYESKLVERVMDDSGDFIFRSGAQGVEDIYLLLDTVEKKQDFLRSFYQVSLEGELLKLGSYDLFKEEGIIAPTGHGIFIMHFYYNINQTLNLTELGFQNLETVFAELRRCSVETTADAVQQCINLERFNDEVVGVGGRLKITLETKQEVLVPDTGSNFYKLRVGFFIK